MYRQDVGLKFVPRGLRCVDNPNQDALITMAIDPAASQDRCVVARWSGGKIVSLSEAPRRGQRLIDVIDYSTSMSSSNVRCDFRLVNWRRAKRLVRSGAAMIVKL
jgi:hypothetical protein